MDHPDFTELQYLATSSEWRTDRYYTCGLMTELMRGWVADYLDPVRCESIGQSRQGREFWAVTVTN